MIYTENNINLINIYIKVVWADTRYVGCSYSPECGGICTYYPGIVDGREPFEPGDTCSNCGDGTECDLDVGLCDGSGNGGYTDGPIIIDDDDDFFDQIDPPSLNIDAGASNIDIECRVTTSSGYSAVIPMDSPYVIGVITMIMAMIMNQIVRMMKKNKILELIWI